MSAVAVVILAAGGSRRFGSIKQLADIEGKFMLQRVIDNCQALAETDIYLVLGANRDEIQFNIKFDTSNIIFNSDWSEGIGSSIRLSTLELQDSYEAILFVAGDQPDVANEKLGRLVEHWLDSKDGIFAASYGDTLGIPAIFPRRFYAQLRLLQGDLGAKSLLLENRTNIRLIEIPKAALDIDEITDLNRLNNME